MQQRTVPETDTPAAVEKTAPIVLSRRSKEAIKVALAMVMVYAIAMQMGWDKPYWAGFTVVTINVLSAGVSLTRGLARSLGTLAGAVAGLAIIALFPQDRWLLMICVSLYLALCTYLLTGKNQSYFWFLAAFTGLIIIGVSSPPEPQSVFQVAVLRTQETAMGAVVYTLIAAFLWPTSSEGLFNGASRKLWATQTQLYRAYRDLMSGNGSAADTRSLRLQEIQLLAQVGGLLGAAESDSYAVWEVRHRWRQFHEQSHAFMKALERWRASFADVRSLDLEQFLPDVAAMNTELDRRFEQIGRMLADKAPTHPAQTITLNVDRDAMDALGHFQRAALVVTQTQLENLERISRSLYECLADIKGYAPRGSAGAMEPPAPWRLTLDADRIRTVVRVLVTQWLAFLLWVYIDPPGHSAFPMLAGIFALIIAMVPQASGALLFITWGGGIALAGVLYVLVMPHLSGFAEVAVMVFGVFFVLQYLLGDLRLTVARMFTMASFLILINIDNQQTYNFAAYANGVAWILLSLGLALATAYIPSSPRPEKVFLRLLRRYFRHAGFLLEGIAPERPEKTGLVRRLQATLYRNDLLEIPGKLGKYAKQIDYRVLPDTTPEQVQELVASLYALAFRIEDLVEAGAYPQAAQVRERLRDDLHAWHQVISARLQRRAEDATQYIEPSANVRTRLAERLAGLEASIQEAFPRADNDALRTEDYSGLYRLLGSYRGLSEAAIEYAQLAEGINWARWHESRF